PARLQADDGHLVPCLLQLVVRNAELRVLELLAQNERHLGHERFLPCAKAGGSLPPRNTGSAREGPLACTPGGGSAIGPSPWERRSSTGWPGSGRRPAWSWASASGRR